MNQLTKQVGLSAVCATLVLMVASSLHAQGGGDQGNNQGGQGMGPGGGFGRRGMGGGGGGGDGGGNNRRSPTEWLQRFDENNNGMLEPSEMNGRARMMLEGVSQAAGLDLTQPISLERLGQALQNSPRFGGGMGGGSGGGFRREGEVGGGFRRDGENRQWENRQENNSGQSPTLTRPLEHNTTTTTPARRFVPGFGLPFEATKTRGFGEAVVANNSAIGTPAGATTLQGSATLGTSALGTAAQVTTEPSVYSEAANPDEKMRHYAESMMAKYDLSKNNILEKSEWKEMSGEPAKADTNADELITLEELIKHYSALSSASSSTSVSSTTGSQNGSAAAKRKRFLTPMERLPSGLPSWFATKDADKNGQISMSEFTTTWTNEEATRFARYDANRDGIITPQECLKVERGSARR